MIDYTFSMVELEFFLLVLMRVTSFIFAAPFFSMTGTPRRVRVALGVFIAILLYRLDLPHETLEYQSVLGYSVLVIKEMTVGILVGFSAQICTQIMNFAGRNIDMNIGLSMMSMMDPTTRENTSITGIYLNYFSMLILLISGLYQFLIRALADTYRLIPVGGAVFNQERLLHVLTVFLSDYLIIGFRISLPIFCVIMIVNVVLGILAKVAPQLNMFAVGIQIKLLLGLATLFLTVAILPGATDFIMVQMKKLVTQVMEAML